MRTTLILAMGLALASCSEHTVDTFPEWCEQITGVDLEEKYAPFWAVLFSVSFDGEAIRDDYVAFLDETHMQKVEGRAPRMAWREGTELHVVNLSSFLMVEPEAVIGEWRRGIEAAKAFRTEMPAEACLYGTVSSLFDSMNIHSMSTDAIGAEWNDEVTEIPTDRRDRLGDGAL